MARHKAVPQPLPGIDEVLCCPAGFSAHSPSVQCQLWAGEKEPCPSPGSQRGSAHSRTPTPACIQAVCLLCSIPARCCRALSSTPRGIGANKSSESPQPPQGWHPNNGKHGSTASHLRHHPITAPSRTALLQSPPQRFPYHVPGLLFPPPHFQKWLFFSFSSMCATGRLLSPLRREPLKHFESRTVIQALAAPSTAPTNLTHDTTEQGTSKVSLTANPGARRWRDMAWGAASPCPADRSLRHRCSPRVLCPLGRDAPCHRAAIAWEDPKSCWRKAGPPQTSHGGGQLLRELSSESFLPRTPLGFVSSGRSLHSARCRGSAEGWAKPPRNKQRALRKSCFLELLGRETREAVTASGSGNKLHWDQARSRDLAPSQRRK